MLKPKIKHVNALIPIICKLALNFNNTAVKTKTELINPPRKKKNNSVVISFEMLKFSNTKSKIPWIAIGIRRSFIVASVNELTTPSERNKK